MSACSPAQPPQLLSIRIQGSPTKARIDCCGCARAGQGKSREQRAGQCSAGQGGAGAVQGQGRAGQGKQKLCFSEEVRTLWLTSRILEKPRPLPRGCIRFPRSLLPIIWIYKRTPNKKGKRVLNRNLAMVGLRAWVSSGCNRMLGQSLDEGHSTRNPFPNPASTARKPTPRPQNPSIPPSTLNPKPFNPKALTLRLLAALHHQTPDRKSGQSSKMARTATRHPNFDRRMLKTDQQPKAPIGILCVLRQQGPKP